MSPQDHPIPGLETVRDQEHTHPPVAQVRRADPNDFTLTPPSETQPGQTRIDFSQEPQP